MPALATYPLPTRDKPVANRVANRRIIFSCRNARQLTQWSCSRTRTPIPGDDNQIIHIDSFTDGYALPLRVVDK